MKRLLPCIALAALPACGRGGFGGGGGASVDLKTDEQKTLYTLGLIIGRNLGQFNLKGDDLAIVKAGITDQVSGAKPKVEIAQWAPKVHELQQQRATAGAQAEKDKGKAYAEKAAKEPGAETTPSGLVFIPLKKGTGTEHPKPTDTVKVHYHGTLLDGTVFDSSVERGQPAEFPLNRVIPCWTEGVQKLTVGGKAKLVCPATIAYGDRGSPPKIPGGATLVFEVELFEIKPAPPPPPMSAPGAAGQPPTIGGPTKVVMPGKAGAPEKKPAH
jgi:FKBP-type peptidyl-prolyl cis-trans isomerase FkpA